MHLEPGDFCQVRFERIHPDKGTEYFWRNALFKSVEMNRYRTPVAYNVTYATGEMEQIPIQHKERIREYDA